MMDIDEKWKVHRVATGERIVVRFEARITAEDGEASAVRFVELLGSDTVDVTFDLRGVTGYDRAARDAWQRELAPRRGQVRSVHFVGTTDLTRMGATLFGLAIGTPTTFSEE